MDAPILWTPLSGTNPYRGAAPPGADSLRNPPGDTLPAMEVIAFWTVVVVVWLFCRLTTPAMRSRLVWDFWGAVFVLGAAGVLWSALRY